MRPGHHRNYTTLTDVTPNRDKAAMGVAVRLQARTSLIPRFDAIAGITNWNGIPAMNVEAARILVIGWKWT